MRFCKKCLWKVHKISPSGGCSKTSTVIPQGGFRGASIFAIIHLTVIHSTVVPNQRKTPHCEGKAVWCFSFSLFCGIYIPQGGLRSERFVSIIYNENAPAWRQPKPGRANPNRKIKAGAVSIHHPAEKRKEKM